MVGTSTKSFGPPAALFHGVFFERSPSCKHFDGILTQIRLCSSKQESNCAFSLGGFDPCTSLYSTSLHFCSSLPFCTSLHFCSALYFALSSPWIIHISLSHLIEYLAFLAWESESKCCQDVCKCFRVARAVGGPPLGCITNFSMFDGGLVNAKHSSAAGSFT